jgi:hypothetical protein
MEDRMTKKDKKIEDLEKLVFTLKDQNNQRFKSIELTLGNLKGGGNINANRNTLSNLTKTIEDQTGDNNQNKNTISDDNEELNKHVLKDKSK